MTLPDAKHDPDAPTPEEREARIAELRARRHARTRKLAIRSSLIAGLLTLALAVFGYWLLTTIGGRELLLRQITARLPENATLTWEKAEGPASGPLTLHDVRFTWDEVVFTAELVTLDPALRPLFGRRVVLDALVVRDAHLQLAPSDEPFELPRWPEVLPQINPPLALRADDIVIDNFVVTRARERVIAIDRLRGGLAAEPGSLEVEDLVIDSNRGRFTADGTYAPADNYRMDLTAAAVIPTPERRAPLRLGFVARGDLTHLDAAVAGAAPGPVRATLTLRAPLIPGDDRVADTERARWQLRADADALDTALLAGADAPSQTPLSLHLRASGVGGVMRAQGEVEQGAFSATLLPSQITISEQVLAFDPLVVRAFGGEIVVRGRGDFGEEGEPGARELRYAVRARDLQWGDAAGTPVTADATFDLTGTQAAWAVAGNARLERDGEAATLQLAGRGQEQQLQLTTFKVAMPTGTLDVAGTVGWDPRLHWDLRAQLAGFDPGYFAPGWNGAVRGTLTSEGRALETGGFNATATLRDLGGQLRDRRLGGQAVVTMRGQQLATEAALSLGDGELALEGTFATEPQLQWQGEARLSDFDPSLVLDGWDGAVDARLSTRGRARDVTPGDPVPLDAFVDIERLGGTLRGRALGGEAKVAIEGLGGARPVRYRGDVDLRIGNSRIDAEGTIADVLDVDVRLLPLQLADLAPDADGVLRGTLQLSGPRTAPSVVADLEGNNLQWGAMRADSLSAQGRLPWEASARPGALEVRASGLQAGLPIDSLVLQARGAVEALSLEAQASGDAGALALEGQLRRRGQAWTGTIGSLRLDPEPGDAWALQSPASFGWAGQSATLERACLAAVGGGGTLCASANWPSRGVEVEGSGLSLALVEPYLPERDGREWHLRGDFALDAQLQPVGNAWRGQAKLRSSGGGLRLGDAKRELLGYDNLALEATFTPERLNAELAAGLTGNGRLAARVATGWDAYSPLTGAISVNTNELTWMELFSPDIVDPDGRLSGDITLGGTRSNPTIGGQARLDEFTTEVPSLGITLREGQARLDARPDGSAAITGRVRSGDGVLRLDGRLGLESGAAPLVLNVTGENFLAADTRQLEAVIDPNVRVTVPLADPITVTGTVRVPSAEINLERLDRAVKASSDVVVLDPIDGATAELETPVVLDLTLVLGEDVELNGFGLAGGLDGQLRVRTAPGREMTARGQLEIDGRYEAYGQELTIKRGQLNWSGGPVNDPILDIRAEREIGDITAGVDVRGRASAPRASVWSSEGGSQSEALAYLALGRPLSTVTGEEGDQLNAANAALTAGGSLLASQLGARIGLDDAGTIESRSLGGSVFGIGKYLSPKLYIGYGVSLLGTGQVLLLKYLISEAFVLEVESSSVENRGSVNYRIEK
ncbi:translocation/assembly module TamB domain-containing protein [Lysobacter korlensis]|uniref:Translocation/assembly module TamB domain-containing protein n=1 Tax=Lysobacter korlensis TaxID=553636 RepID=A0ABV6RH70_9GAMM